MDNPLIHDEALPRELKKLLTMGAFLGVACMTPYAINNLLQGRYLLMLGGFLIELILIISAFRFHRYNIYQPNFLFLGLTPAIVFTLVISLLEQQIVGALWCYPSIALFYMMFERSKALMANVFLLAATAPFIFNVLELGIAMRVELTLLAISCIFYTFTSLITRQHLMLYTKAVKDPLTGLYNRSMLDFELNSLLGRSSMLSEPLSMALIDLDSFKSVNDTHGHDAGDIALKLVAQTLQHKCRQSDKLFRIGGEEFLVLMPGVDHAQAVELAEELRVLISQKDMGGFHVTASIGLSTHQSGESKSAWFKRADRALYHGKANGRNQVV